MDLPLTAREDQPGWYQSEFIPTQAGPYTFHITGSIEGQAVDATFTSSPGGFNEVQDTAAGQFPVQFPSQADLVAQAQQGADAAAQLPIVMVARRGRPGRRPPRARDRGRRPAPGLIMRRLVVALAAAAAILAAGPVTIGPAAQIALAHSQLLSSTPGSGEILSESPPELRLVFSEPLDPRYSSVDVLNGAGQAIVDHGGVPDPADAAVLIVPLPVLANGAYTVNWRTLSAADGHTSGGFVTFGVGSVNPARVADDPGSAIGGLHGGHDLGTAIIDVEARAVADLGFLLAFGLLVVALGVLRPVLGIRPGVARAQALSLLAGAVAGLVLGFVAGTAPDLDPAGYLLGTRPGQLLVARAAIGAGGAGLAWWLAARGRPLHAVALGGSAGAAAIVLIAVGGHASAFSSPAPVIAMTVHLGAVGTWLAGLGTLVALFRTETDRAWVRPVVSRFSALALVSIALVGATGVYSAWVETGNLLGLDTPYQGSLWIKVALVVAALAIGGVNYLTSGRG